MPQLRIVGVQVGGLAPANSLFTTASANSLADGSRLVDEILVLVAVLVAPLVKSGACIEGVVNVVVAMLGVAGVWIRVVLVVMIGSLTPLVVVSLRVERVTICRGGG